MSTDILSQYPRAQAFLTEDEAFELPDVACMYAVIDRLLLRIEALENA